MVGTDSILDSVTMFIVLLLTKGYLCICHSRVKRSTLECVFIDFGQSSTFCYHVPLITGDQ